MLIALALVLILFGVTNARTATAQTTTSTTASPLTFPQGPITTVAPNSPGTLPDGDDVPSCSLFPTRLGPLQWFFTNLSDFPITLQIVTTSTGGLTGPVGTQIVVFDGTLGGGESTGIFTLTPDTTIHWAGGTYHLSAYDFVNCLAEEGGGTTTTGTILTSSTTTPSITTPFSVPPGSSTTVPPTVPGTTPFTVPSTTAPSTSQPSTSQPVTTRPPTTFVDQTVPQTFVLRDSTPTTTHFPFGTTGGVSGGGVTPLIGVATLILGVVGLLAARRLQERDVARQS